MAEALSAAGWQSPRLPWSSEQGEKKRFVGLLLGMLLLFLPPAWLIPAMQLPERDRAEMEQVPPRLARLVERPKPVVAPKPVPEKPEPVAEAKPEQAEKQPRVPPEPAKKMTKSAEPTPAAPETQTARQAREKASRSGLLALKDRLASLRDSEPAPAPTMSANTGDDVPEKATQPDPAGVLAGSGGVGDSPAPSATVEVAGHQVKKVEARPEPAAQVVADSGQAPAEPSFGERAMSNIRKVFNSQKNALYSLYRRELRQDPTLEGKVLLELVIEPDGSVSACDVISSELENPTLEQRIAMRVRLFNFGAAEVEQRKVRFPIDFLPG